jgi:hypothetical protein
MFSRRAEDVEPPIFFWHAFIGASVRDQDARDSTREARTDVEAAIAVADAGEGACSAELYFTCPEHKHMLSVALQDFQVESARRRWCAPELLASARLGRRHLRPPSLP